MSERSPEKADVRPVTGTRSTVQVERTSYDDGASEPQSVKEFEATTRASSPFQTESSVETQTALGDGIAEIASKVSRLVKESTEDTDASQMTGLLGLPYELRIEIYRYSVLQSNTIPIDTIIPSEPPLLAVNKQIRLEASEVYYGENKFAGHIFHFDSTIYLRWRQLSRFEPIHPTCKWRVRSSHNWANLKAWMKADFEDDLQDLSVTVRLEGKLTVDIGAFALMRKLKSEEKSWEAIEPYLEHVLEILIGTDNKRWKRSSG